VTRRSSGKKRFVTAYTPLYASRRHWCLVIALMSLPLYGEVQKGVFRWPLRHVPLGATRVRRRRRLIITPHSYVTMNFTSAASDSYVCLMTPNQSPPLTPALRSISYCHTCSLHATSTAITTRRSAHTQ